MSEQCLSPVSLALDASERCFSPDSLVLDAAGRYLYLDGNLPPDLSGREFVSVRVLALFVSGGVCLQIAWLQTRLRGVCLQTCPGGIYVWTGVCPRTCLDTSLSPDGSLSPDRVIV